MTDAARTRDLEAEFRAKSLGAMFQTARRDVTDAELDERLKITLAHPSLDTVWDSYTAQLIRASCAYLAQEFLTGPLEPPYNGRFLVGEHHEDWDDLVCKYKRICVLAPRDHGKTFFFNFAYPIWKALTMPGGKGFIFSATAPQAERILEDIKQELESNPKLRWLVPAKKDKWSGKHIRLTNGHQIYARGFGTKVRGAHPNWIVVDDGMNDETAYSEVVRKKQIDYFFNAITNMCVPGGQIIVVGTPFHQADLYGELEKNPEYKFKRYPALNEDTQQPLWTDRYDKARLEAKRREIGSIRFAREFLCVPVADDMSLFPSYLFKGEPVEQYTIKLGMPGQYWERLGITRYMGVDFAISSNVSADYTVIWTMGVDARGNRWVIDIYRKKGQPYQTQLSKIVEIARKYEPALIFIEANQMQRIFGDELIRTTDLPIKKFVTTAQNKNVLDKGVPSLRVLFENGKIRIPRGDAHSVEMTNVWRDEMRNFTFNEGKVQTVGEHDDTVMAFWICDQAIRQGAFSFTFGSDDKDQTLDDIINESMNDPVDDGSGTFAMPQANKGKAEVKQKAYRGQNAYDPIDDGSAEPPKASGNLFDDEEMFDLPVPPEFSGI